MDADRVVQEIHRRMREIVAAYQGPDLPAGFVSATAFAEARDPEYKILAKLLAVGEE